MTDTQIIVSAGTAFILIVLAPLIFLFAKGPWPFRKTIPSLAILAVLFLLLYTPIHELSHVAGALLSGLRVVQIQLFPKIVAGRIVTARYVPIGIQHDWQFLVMTGFPYLLDIVSLVIGILVLRRERVKNSFIVGLLFALLCLRPLFDFIGEMLGYLSRNGGDLHQISMYLGDGVTWLMISLSMGLALFSVLFTLNRYTEFLRPRSGKKNDLTE